MINFAIIKQKYYLMFAFLIFIIASAFIVYLLSTNNKATLEENSETTPTENTYQETVSIKMLSVIVKKVVTERHFLVTDKDGVNFEVQLEPEGHINYVLDNERNLPIKTGDIFLLDSQLKAVEGGNLTVKKIVVLPIDKK